MLCRERDSCREKDPSRRMRGREEEGCVFEQERNDWSINVYSPLSKPSYWRSSTKQLGQY